MSNEHNDKYAGIFDDASVADFIVETSAVSEMSRTNHGADAFSAFVEEQLRSIRTAYLASQGEYQPVGILVNGETQRLFAPDDEETIGEFVQRLHREATSMRAVWTFVSIKTKVMTYQADAEEEMDAVNDAGRAQRNLDQMVPGLVWYAERREGDEQHRRQGVMPEASADGILGASQEGAESQPFPLFTLILGA